MPETVIDRLSYILGIDDRPLQAGAKRAETTLKRIDSVAKRLAGFGIASGGVLLLGQRLFRLGASVVTAAANMARLTAGLTAVAGSSEEAQRQLADLQEVAKLPGLGLEEAISGSINLQAVGFSAEQAQKSLSAFGNALATVGKGRAELQGVILALTQMQAKGKIAAEEINQIAERVPQIRAVMQRAFGTAASEDLQKMGISASDFIRRVTDELAKLPRVAGGAANAFENLGDSLFQVRTRLGRIVLPQVTSFVEGLAGGFEFLSQRLETTDEKLLRLSNSFKAATEEFETTNAELEELRKQYNGLQDQLSETTEGTDENKKIHAELNTVIAALVKIVPTLAGQWDREAAALTGLNKGLEANKIIREATLRSEFLFGLEEFEEAIVNVTTRLDASENAFETIRDNAKEIGRGISNFRAILLELGLTTDEMTVAIEAFDKARFNGVAGIKTTDLVLADLSVTAAKSSKEFQALALQIKAFVDAGGDIGKLGLDLTRFENALTAAREAPSKVVIDTEKRETFTIFGPRENLAAQRRKRIRTRQAAEFLEFLNKEEKDRVKAEADRQADAEKREAREKQETDQRIEAVAAEHAEIRKLQDALFSIQNDALEAQTSKEITELKKRFNAFRDTNFAQIQEIKSLGEVFTNTQAVIDDSGQKVAKSLGSAFGQMFTSFSTGMTSLATDAVAGARAVSKATVEVVVDAAKGSEEANKAAIDRMVNVTTEAELKTARFKFDLNELTLGEFRQSLVSRLQAVEAVSGAESDEYRRLALKLHSINQDIQADSENTLRQIDENWQRTISNIIGVLQAFQGEIEGVFGQIVDSATNAAEGIARAFSGDIGGAITSFFNFVGSINRELEKSKAAKTRINDMSEAFIGLINVIEQLPSKDRQPFHRQVVDFTLEDIDPRDPAVVRDLIQRITDVGNQVERIVNAQSQRMKTAGERIAAAFTEGLKLGFTDAPFKEISALLSKSINELMFDAIAAAALEKTAIEGLGRQFQIVLADVLEDEKIDEREKATLQAARRLFEQKQKQGIEFARQLAEAAGLDPAAFETAATKQAPQTTRGLSLAIRQITTRQADELAIIQRGSQSLLSSIRNDTRRSADALENWLPSIDERIAMIDGGIGAGREQPAFRDDNARKARLAILGRQRAQGRVNQ